MVRSSTSSCRPRAPGRGARCDSDTALWRRCAAGDRQARDALIERHLGLARALAHRYTGSSEPIEDLEQVASLALVRAVDRFDPRRGVSFSTFAVPTILGELKRHFRDHTWGVHMPRALRDAAYIVDRATARLAGQLGRHPTAAEVAAETGYHVELVIEARQAARAYRCDSLDRPAGGLQEDGAATVGERIGRRDGELNRAEAAIALEQIAARTLSRRDREVLRLRVEEDLLQREIAERVGVSQMQISRILSDVMRRLRAVP